MAETTGRDEALADLADLVLRLARDLDPHAPGAPAVVALTPTEIAIVQYVRRHPGASPSQVAAGTRLQRSNLSTALRQLEAKGFLVRSVDPLDARSLRLALTPLALENVLRVRAHWAGRLRGVLGDRPEAVRDALTLLHDAHEELKGR